MPNSNNRRRRDCVLLWRDAHLSPPAFNVLFRARSSLRLRSRPLQTFASSITDSRRRAFVCLSHSRQWPPTQTLTCSDHCQSRSCCLFDGRFLVQSVNLSSVPYFLNIFYHVVPRLCASWNQPGRCWSVLCSQNSCKCPLIRRNKLCRLVLKRSIFYPLFKAKERAWFLPIILFFL